MLHKETVRPEFLSLLYRLTVAEPLKNFVLVGGTALSLRIGNRKSLDIDLFTAGDFPGDSLIAFLEENAFNFRQQSRFKGGLLGHIDNIKVDFIRHGYPWVQQPELIDGIRIASLEDIAAMKLNAISGNGSRIKDFVDIAFLSGYMTLSDMLSHYEKKYPNINGVMALKSLCYFDDIDFSVTIEYTNPAINWEMLKARILKMVRNPEKQFTRL